MKDDLPNDLQKSYFDVLGICCPSEVPLIEKILKPIEGVHHVSVIVPSRTVIVVHDAALISQFQIVKALNKARLEANVRMKGDQNYGNKWPSPYAAVCGVLLLLSFLEYIYSPLKWLSLGAVAVGIIPLTLKAIASLRNLRFDINLLMLIAVGGSISLKDYWEAGTIVFLLVISEWLEARASHKATAVMSSLMSIAPQKAILADTGEEVNANEVKVNTRLAVKAGSMVPIDGIVVEGKCEVDEKTLTGESFPVCKQVDSIVYAGTLNINGYITVKSTVLAEACVVARMAKLVEEAQNNKSKTQRYIDEFAKYYTPAVVLVAASLAAIPAAMRAHNLDKWYHLALVVLVSACPCALILSTPIAAFCALSKAATLGVLIKGAEYLETLSKVKFVCFDKTGTLTRGEFSVTDFHPLIDVDILLYWVSSIESKSDHPMAEALVDYAQSHSIEPQPDNVDEFNDFPGEGVYGKIDGNDVYIGNQKIGVRAGCSTVMSQSDNKGRSTAYIFLGSSPVGIFYLSDSTRIGVQEALEELKFMGIMTTMLTGDCQEAANYAQNQLGGAIDIVHAGLLPQDKAKIIKEIQKEYRVAMVGDGLNDAPALATADIGIAMGVSGSALANETGHVILMSNDIRKIPIAVRLARKTRRKIFENIFIAMVIKSVVIALAIAGHPLVWAAVLADMGTCLVVIFNSMFLLRGVTSRIMKNNPASSQCLAKSMINDKSHNMGSFGLEINKSCCNAASCNLVVEQNCCGVDGSGLKVKDNYDDMGCCGLQAKENCCDVASGGCGLQVREECCDVSVNDSKVEKSCCDTSGYSSKVKDKSYDVVGCGSEAKNKFFNMGGCGSQVNERLHDVGACYLEVKDNSCNAGGYGLEVEDTCCDVGVCGSVDKDKNCGLDGCGSEVKDKCLDVGGFSLKVKDSCRDMGGCVLKVHEKCCNVSGCCLEAKVKCCDVNGYDSKFNSRFNDIGDYYLDVKDNCCNTGGCASNVKEKCHDVVGCGSEAKCKCCNVDGCGSHVKEKLYDVDALYLEVKDIGYDVGDYDTKVKGKCCDVGSCGLVAKDKKYVVDGYGPKVTGKCHDASGFSLEVKDNYHNVGGCGSKVEEGCCNMGGCCSNDKDIEM